MKPDTLKEYRKLRADGMNAKVAFDIARYNVKMRASPFYRANDGERITFKRRKFTVRGYFD